jgi:hypothetical protein
LKKKRGGVPPEKEKKGGVGGVLPPRKRKKGGLGGSPPQKKNINSSKLNYIKNKKNFMIPHHLLLIKC